MRWDSGVRRVLIAHQGAGDSLKNDRSAHQTRTLHEVPSPCDEPAVFSTTPRSIGRNAAAKLASESVGRLASLALTVMVARQLGASDLGVYSHALAVGLVLAQLADLGVQVTSAREVAVNGGQARRFVAGALRAKCLFSVTVLALFLLLASAQPPPLRAIYVCLGLAMLAQTFLEFAAHVWRGQQELGREARLLSGARVAVALVGGFALWQRGNLTAVAAAFFLVTAFCSARALLQLHRSGWFTAERGSAPTPLREVMRAALPLGIATVVSIAYTRLAILLLDHLLGETAVGHFAAAQRLIEPCQIIPASLMAAVFPVYAGHLAVEPQKALRLARTSVSLLTAVGTLLALALWFSAPFVVKILLTDAFAESIPVLRVLGLAAVPVFANYGLTHLLIARGQQRLNLLFVAFTFTLHAVLSLRLIPEIGATGAAVSVVVAEVVLALCCISALVWSSPRRNGPSAPEDRWLGARRIHPAPPRGNDGALPSRHGSAMRGAALFVVAIQHLRLRPA